MSRQLISRNGDLRQLSDDGYDVDIVAGHLVMRDVPYVDQHRRIRRGTLVSRLTLAGDVTIAPNDHQAWFAGALPCDREGRPLIGMVHANQDRDHGGGLRTNHWLCSRPLGREFKDHHEKMTTFALQISNHATAIDPTVSARTGRIVSDQSDESPFVYVDTATPRSGIGSLADRIAGLSIGIVGLGGTGGYILDLVSKTPVGRIHLFDDDVFLQHNGFRTPGAVPVEDLAARRLKVVHFDRIYSRLHKGIVPHAVRMAPANFHLLDHLDFVFVAIDDGRIKTALVERLEDRGLPFIDVGMGLHFTEDGLAGTVRVTTSTPSMRDHVWDRQRIPMGYDPADDPYRSNIQVGELNALNAALAVIRWKKMYGFYVDLEREHFSVYGIDGNHLLNEDGLRDE